jgi:hypothetical protein
MARALIRGSSQILAESIFDAQIAAAANIATSKLAEGAEFLQRDGSVVFTASLDAGGFKITNAAEGTAGSDYVTLSQLQDNAAGLDPKESVAVATTPADGNIDLATGGLLTIDGVVTQTGYRVLVKNQTDPIENGIYVADAGTWIRSEDFDGTPVSEVSGGARTFVEAGTVNINSAWVVTGLGNRIVGTDAINWTIYTGAGSFSAGAGLGQSGSNIFVNEGDGIEVIADNVTVKLDGSTLALSAAGVKLADLASGQVLVGNGSNIATAVTLSGDVAIDNAGVATIQPGAVSNTEIAGGAAIDTSKLADGANFIQRGGTVAFTADQPHGGFKITGLGDGVALTDAATVGQIDALDTALQAEIDAIELGAGLNTDGTYTANAGTNYIKSADFTTAALAESLNNADRLLDAAIKQNADDIAALGTGSITALQDEIDAIELSMGPGLMTTGGVFVGYTTSNYMNAAINVNGILQALDAQIKTNEDDIAALVIDNGDIQAELDATQLGAGLNTDGTFQTFVGTNFLDAATSLYDALNDMDTGVQTALDAKLDDTQLIDDDTFASATATNIPSAESTKAYVDAQIASETVGFVDAEEPTGAIDGVNTTYTLAGTPLAGSVKLMFNGQVLREGATNDFQITGSTITTLFTPETGDQLWVDYRI